MGISVCILLVLHCLQFSYFLILTQSPFICWWHPVVHILTAHQVQWKCLQKSNFHYTDFLVTSSSDELARKLRGCYGLVANFWPSPRGSHGEVGRVGPSRRVKMVWRVGGLVGDKSCRVAVMEIGERHDTTRHASQASATTNHIGNINKK